VPRALTFGVAVVFAAAGCGAGSVDDPGRGKRPPGGQVAELPAGVVARVGSAEITRRDADHWTTAARLQKGTCRTTRTCRRSAMQFLISAQWLLQEAAHTGVTVSEREVSQTFKAQRRQAFRTDQEYQAFLETSGRTEGDLRFQVRLNLLTDSLQRTTAPPKAPGTNARLQAFVARFRIKYKRRTVCRLAYSVARQCKKVVP
jgi:hypothetical protein